MTTAIFIGMLSSYTSHLKQCFKIALLGVIQAMIDAC